MWNSILAKLFLAWTFLLHLLKKLLPRGKSGAKKFMENYGPEGLRPLSSVDKNWMFQFSKCLNCNFCDTACPSLLKLPRDVFPGPSYLGATLTRSPADLWAVPLDLSMCGECDQCQRACPNLVPIKEALEFIEAKNHEVWGQLAS